MIAPSTMSNHTCDGMNLSWNHESRWLMGASSPSRRYTNSVGDVIHCLDWGGSFGGGRGDRTIIACQVDLPPEGRKPLGSSRLPRNVERDPLDRQHEVRREPAGEV